VSPSQLAGLRRIRESFANTGEGYWYARMSLKTA